eukprot:581206-Lingulodinium_polyedra.AAC.1
MVVFNGIVRRGGAGRSGLRSCALLNQSRVRVGRWFRDLRCSVISAAARRFAFSVTFQASKIWRRPAD